MDSAKRLPTQLCRFEDGRIHSGFVIWQKIYADYGLSTFPVEINEKTKKPMVRGWMKTSPYLSSRWGQDFPFAPAIGVLLGRENGIAELDVDTKDDRVLADALDRHGDTQIVIRSASTKFKAWYRFNGECRRIKPWPDLPIDLLGAGFTVGPPSFHPGLDYRQYELIQGKLDDLDRLPVMRNLEPELYATYKRGNKLDGKKTIGDKASPMRDMREGDGRNKELFQTIGPIAREVYADGKGVDELLNAALSHNSDCAEPLPIEEVRKIVTQVWKMTLEHRNWIGRSGDRRTEVTSFAGDVDAYFLLEWLRVSEGASSSFWLANGLAEKFGWTVKRFARARERLIELGYIAMVKRAWSGSPASYIWA